MHLTWFLKKAARILVVYIFTITEQTVVILSLDLLLNFFKEYHFFCTLNFVLGLDLFVGVVLERLTEVFRFIANINVLLHFACYALEQDVAIVEDAYLEIVTQRPKQSIQVTQNVRYLTNTQPRARQYVLSGESHF